MGQSELKTMSIGWLKKLMTISGRGLRGASVVHHAAVALNLRGHDHSYFPSQTRCGLRSRVFRRRAGRFGTRMPEQSDWEEELGNFKPCDTPGARNSVRELAPGHFEFGSVCRRGSLMKLICTPPIARLGCRICVLAEQRARSSAIE